MLHEPKVDELYPEQVQLAERNLVALSIVDPAAALGCNVNGRHVFNARLAAIWRSVESLYTAQSSVDIIAIADALSKEGLLDACGGIAYIGQLLSANFPDVRLAERYAETIRSAWAARELRRVASEVPGALSAGAPVHEVADRLRNFINGIEDVPDRNCTTIADELTAENARIVADVERVQAGMAVETGLPTGLGLERVVPGGIPRDRLTLLFGETGTYKTAIKQVISDAICATGKYVLDFTLEDSAELTAQRFLARHTGIPYGRIAARELSSSEVERIAALEPVAKEIAARTLVVGNVPATIEEAVRLSRYWARKVPLAAVFVDYVQLLETNRRDNEAQQLYEVCKTAQRAAHRDKLAWVLVSQVNRRAADRPDKAPQLVDLYGGSAVGHTTKLAIGIYRPWNSVFGNSQPPDDSPWYSLYKNDPDGPLKYRYGLELHIRKNVVGEAGVVHRVTVEPGTGRIEPVKL